MNSIINKLILIGLLLSTDSCFPTCDSYLGSKAKLNFSGVVKAKSESDIGCFGNIIIDQKGDLISLERVCNCTGDKYNFYKYCQIGDSLIKNSGSIQVKVIKKDSSKFFDYPCCIK